MSWNFGSYLKLFYLALYDPALTGKTGGMRGYFMVATRLDRSLQSQGWRLLIPAKQEWESQLPSRPSLMPPCLGWEGLLYYCFPCSFYCCNEGMALLQDSGASPNCPLRFLWYYPSRKQVEFLLTPGRKECPGTPHCHLQERGRGLHNYLRGTQVSASYSNFPDTTTAARGWDASLQPDKGGSLDFWFGHCSLRWGWSVFCGIRLEKGSYCLKILCFVMLVLFWSFV